MNGGWTLCILMCFLTTVNSNKKKTFYTESDYSDDMPSNINELGEECGLTLFFDRVHGRLMRYLAEQENSCVFSDFEIEKKLREFLTQFEAVDQAYVDLPGVSTNPFESLKNSVISMASEIYCEEGDYNTKQLKSKIPIFFRGVDKLLDRLLANFRFLSAHNKLYYLVSMIASQHIRAGNVTASCDKAFIYRMFCGFISQSARFYSRIFKDNSDLFYRNKRLILEDVRDFKEAIDSFIFSYNLEFDTAVVALSKSFQNLIENLLSSFNVQAIAFGNNRVFTSSDKKIAFEVLIRSKAISGFIFILVNCLDKSKKQNINLSEFNKFITYFLIYFLDYNKLSLLIQEID